MNQNTENLNEPQITFARLPIFDRKKNLWGYELVHLSRTGLSADLMSDTSIALEQVMDASKKIIVEFSCRNILEKLPYGLPPGRTIVKFAIPKIIPDGFMEQLHQLKKDDYKIAVLWNKKHAEYKDIFKAADLVFVGISNKDLPEIKSILKSIESYNSQSIAHQVDNQNIFDICLCAEISFIGGSFFKQPEDLAVKKIMSATVSRFKIMEAIEKNDPDFDKLSKILQEDVSISFRLLSHLNSASFGFRRKIDSIKDAITMLGWNNLKNWLRVIALGEMSDSKSAPELIFLSAQRGKFLEQVGRDHDFWGFNPDSLFLLGMFSLLDALLNRPMPEIVKHIPLADKLKGALCMQTDNEYVHLLKLARLFEEAKFDKTDEMINQLALNSQKVGTAYKKSIEWANQLNYRA